ncbi:MAG: DUF3999 family protein [Sulfurimicrobium sp.]|nr:DUF3999 family protein [Sulfurimicrobium sp.]
MMRWLALLLIPFFAQAEDLSGAWQHWQYSRPLQSPPGPTAWLRATLPAEIYGPARTSLADLRVIDRNGKEVPYLLHAQQEQCQRAWRNAPVSDTGFTHGEYSQAVIDTGSNGAPHNAIQINLDQKDFFTWTEIAASDDRLNWRIVRDKAPLFRFEQDSLTNGQVLSYPRTRSRWLRLRFLQGEKALRATGARITEESKTEAQRAPLPAAFSLAARQADGESLWEADLGKPRPPVSAIHFETSQAEFHRQVKISSSDDGKNWRSAGQGHIYRHADDGKQRSELEIVFPESHARLWRVTLLNHSDPALPGLRLEMLGVPRQVVFKREVGQDYRLLYGNPRATAPKYELAQISRPEHWQAAPATPLGAEQRNSAYVSAEAWSERHPWLLWTALLIAVGGLAWMAINALRPDNAGAQETDK